ncbi:MAG: alpha/beta hydrolase, partial [Bacteroidetes bacterium]|nr:alpha/beta hydrolase [Bacteroidota bacterium]
MKKILLFTFTLLLSISMHSQDISGKWNGVLKVSGQSLRIVFNITQAENGEGFQATMDSPDQGARGIPVNSITFEGNEVILNILAAGISYKGTLSEANYIEGTFTQGSFSTLMALEKVTTEEPALKRPQEPIPPFPYHSEDITFDNQEADITLAGTLT